MGLPNTPSVSAHLIKHHPPQQHLNPTTFKTPLWREHAETKRQMAEDVLHLTTPRCRASVNPSASAPLQPGIVPALSHSYTEEAPTGVCDLCPPPSLGCLPQTTGWPLKSWLIWRVGFRWAGGQSRAAFFIFTHFCSRCLPQFSDPQPAPQLMLPSPSVRAAHLPRLPCQKLRTGAPLLQMSPLQRTGLLIRDIYWDVYLPVTSAVI